MWIGAIDMGTNSTRLLIADYSYQGVQEIYKDLRTTRIGEGMEKFREIKPQVLQRTIDCLQEYQRKCALYQVETIRTVATSAVRDASNKVWVLEQIKEKTGLTVQVLTGTEEAKLSYLGATGGEGVEGLPKMVVDIGGGSTELIYPTPEGIEFKSVNLGAVRLKENKDLKPRVQEILKQLITSQFPSNFTLIGVGGTITTLAAIKLELETYDGEQVEGFKLTSPEISQIYNQLITMSLAQRKNLKGLQPERADIITYGTLILKELLRMLDKDEITVSEKDILQGIIITTAKGES